MSTIDDLLPCFRSHLPGPTAQMAEQVIASLGDDLPSHRPAPPGRTRRLVTVVGGAATLAAVGTLAVVTTHVRQPERPTRTAGPARVAWGMATLLRVTPDHGVDLEDATSRAIDALKARGTANDIAGLQLSSPEPGRIRMVVPAAEERFQLWGFVSFTSLLVVPEDQIVARGTLADFSPFAVPLVPDAGKRFLVEFPHPRGQSGAIAVVATLADARSLADRLRTTTSRRSQPPRILAVSDTYLPVVHGLNRYSLVSTLLAARATIGPPNGTTGMTGMTGLTVRDADLARLRPRTGSRSRRALVVQLTSAAPAGAGELGTVDVTAATQSPIAVGPLQRQSLMFLRQQMAEPALEGMLTPVSYSRYGRRPDPSGPVTSVLRPARGQIEGPARLALTFADPNGPVDLAVGRRRGEEFAVTIARRTGAITWMGTCPVGLGAPPLMPCFPAPPDLPTWQVFGHVNSDVASVEATLADGSTVAGMVGNGWFYVSVGRRLPSRRYPELVAKDAAGRVIVRRRVDLIRRF